MSTSRMHSDRSVPDSPRQSFNEDLEEAICLLALVLGRPPDLDGSLNSYKELHGKTGDVVRTSSAADGPETSELDIGNMDMVISAEPDGMEDIEDLEVVSVDCDQEQYLYELRSKVLDRLAEVLARFKSDPKARNAPDAKHVASTMMVAYKGEERVKILCSKNEGLDGDDRRFLEDWKSCMEAIARTGAASEEQKTMMFDLVFKHQRPRISTYMKWLKYAFQPSLLVAHRPNQNQANLLESWVKTQPLLKSRKWVDDNELEYEIPINTSVLEEKVSEAALTGESLKDFDVVILELFDVIKTLCNSETSQETQDNLLKTLMRMIFDLWKGARCRSAVKAYLSRHFGHDQKRRKEAEKVLLFLCKIYYAAHTFVEAGEKLPYFKAIECLLVPYQSRGRRKHPHVNSTTPLVVAKKLGIATTRSDWIRYFNQKDAEFKTLLVEKRRKRHFHAEIQTLFHRDFLLSPDEKKQAHRYIGCSRRCCLLCYFFVLAHGGFGVRGTHETVMHRWDIPELPSSVDPAEATPYVAATERVLEMVKYILQRLFGSAVARQPHLLAQSSDALSSARTVMEKETAQLEKSQRDIQRLMMMPMVANDGILIHNDPKRLGYAYVIESRFPKGKQMTLTEAELLKDEQLRSKFGLESRSEMPPRSLSSFRVCKRCRRPSYLRCSACRMAYCSKTCQAKDWKRHVFVCSIKGRPNDVDRLRIFTKRLSRLSPSATPSRSKLLMDLFSDDDLCRTFGFNNCVEEHEVAFLICIYINLMVMFGCLQMQHYVNAENIAELIQIWISVVKVKESDAESHYTFIPWYLHRLSTGFQIPNHEGPYLHQSYAMVDLQDKFYPEYKESTPPTPSGSERSLIALYCILLRDFNNIPDARTEEWIQFGFCYCKTDAQRKALATAYIKLADTGLTLSTIASAWTTSSLGPLMKSKGIDISGLEADRIRFESPDMEELGIYRLVAETNHLLSGTWCPCYQPYCPFHSKHEPLSKESEGDYGFHGVNAWERWQLLNFYLHIFTLPDFDADEMQRAKRDEEDHEALERYLDSLVPDFRRKIGNMYLADVMFPKVRARVRFPNGRPECLCIVHSTLTSEGVDVRALGRINFMRRRLGLGDDDGDASEKGEGEGGGEGEE